MSLPVSIVCYRIRSNDFSVYRCLMSMLIAFIIGSLSYARVTFDIVVISIVYAVCDIFECQGYF